MRELPDAVVEAAGEAVDGHCFCGAGLCGVLSAQDREALERVITAVAPHLLAGGLSEEEIEACIDAIASVAQEYVTGPVPAELKSALSKLQAHLALLRAAQEERR